MDKTSLGDRIKGYENVSASKLMRRTPVIIRVDGKSFHTFTKQITPELDSSVLRGFSELFHGVMTDTASAVAANMQNTVVAYTQSDEISFVLRDWDRHETQQWFDGKIQKIVSVSAALTTAYFNYYWQEAFGLDDALAFFDARAFNVPHEEVNNYFVWRQQDATRNSLQFIARKFFSHKELHKKSGSDIQDMLMLLKDVNWNDYEVWQKRGACIRPFTNVISPKYFGVDHDTPIFSKQPDYIEDLMRSTEDFMRPNDG